MRYKEVEFRESEFTKACELDVSEIKNIRNEYLMGAFVYPLIGNLIALTVVALWFAGVIQKLYVISEVIELVLMLLVAFSVAISAYLTVRCIFERLINGRSRGQEKRIVSASERKLSFVIMCLSFLERITINGEIL